MSTTSTKRKPSAFELSGSGSKKRKGRGRPKKPVVESLGQPPAKKMGRGRPRKATAKEIDHEESEAEATEGGGETGSGEELPEDICFTEGESIKTRSGRELKKLPLGSMKVNKHVNFEGDDNELFNPFGVEMTASSDTGPPVDTLASYSVYNDVDVEVYKAKKHIRPTSLIRHISTISDVRGDGNCGFRAAAVSMGRNSHEWSDIRKEMKQEFDKNPLYSDEKFDRNQPFLENIWGEARQDLIEALSWNTEGTLAPTKFCMHFCWNIDSTSSPHKRRAINSFHTPSNENRSKRIACEMSRDVNDVTNVFDHDQRSSSSSLKLSDRISTPLSDCHYLSVE
ncbi:hypothetical protein PSTG_04558 [Puccinia striiformis f. sp. tritici PST-78]|uniref:OTU domain-containing protein n=1 Tax=Puccinia striiformis f. sp. tritici PST-78 TaxID=1165861 RepID=A0A0L0VTM3_9BASI|nr:hypothetical protein PSTG_04558 [Puccinia striiformis f. sp. tritici PST-78]